MAGVNLTNVKQLTSPVAVTKPTEQLAVADFYKEKGRGVVNSIQDKAKELGINLSAIAQGGRAARDLIPLVNAVRTKDPNFIFSRAMGALGKDGPLLKILPESYRATVAENIKDYGSQVYMLRDVAYAVQGTNFEDINSLTRAVNQISGNPDMAKFVDNDGVAGALASVVIEAKQLGLPSMLNEVTNTVTDTQLLVRTAMLSLPSSIRYSDTQMLGQISDVVGSGNLIQAQPKVVEEFIRNYEKDATTREKTIEESYNEMIEVLTKVNPYWRLETRSASPSPIGSVMFLRTGSSSFLQLMRDGSRATGDRVMQLMLAANSLPYETVQVSAQRLFKRRYVV